MPCALPCPARSGAWHAPCPGQLVTAHGMCRYLSGFCPNAGMVVWQRAHAMRRYASGSYPNAGMLAWQRAHAMRRYASNRARMRGWLSGNGRMPCARTCRPESEGEQHPGGNLPKTPTTKIYSPPEFRLRGKRELLCHCLHVQPAVNVWRHHRRPNVAERHRTCSRGRDACLCTHTSGTGHSPFGGHAKSSPCSVDDYPSTQRSRGGDRTRGVPGRWASRSEAESSPFAWIICGWLQRRNNQTHKRDEPSPRIRCLAAQLLRTYCSQ